MGVTILRVLHNIRTALLQEVNPGFRLIFFWGAMVQVSCISIAVRSKARDRFPFYVT